VSQYCVAVLEKDAPFSAVCALSWKTWFPLNPFYHVEGVLTFNHTIILSLAGNENGYDNIPRHTGRNFEARNTVWKFCLKSFLK